MKTYKISTDNGSQEIEAANLAEALAEWGEAPESVKTAEQWEAWIDGMGGYGNIDEDGVQIARVAP